MTNDHDAAGRLRAYVTTWRKSGGVPVAYFQLMPIVEEFLDEHAAAIARIAELEAFLPPVCTHCGERNKNGSYSEHDNTWLCDGCHAELSRGGDLAPTESQETTA